VLSTDQIANDVVASDPSLKEQLSSSFGQDIYDDLGVLDRPRLASIVFRDSEKLRKLNSLVHPHVLKILQKKIRNLPPRQRYPFIVVESALIFEAGLENFFDVVLLVHAPREIRVRRVRKTKGLTRKEFLARTRTQTPRLDAKRRAHFSISNGGSIKRLKVTVRLLDTLLSTLRQSFHK